mgnify:CR=1 FL=1
MKKKEMIALVLLLSIATIFLGISVAIFNYFGKGTNNNVIQTGKIVFSYSDADFGSYEGNGVNIVNAYPISDEKGKSSIKTNEYFDFTITASTTNTDLAYEIVANKGDNSTLEEDKVKIYLTEFDGNNEVPTSITGTSVVPTYSELKNTTNGLLKGKTIYFGTVKAGEVAYGKKFRFRMWLSDKDVDEQTISDTAPVEQLFTARINVAAIGNN